MDGDSRTRDNQGSILLDQSLKLYDLPLQHLKEITDYFSNERVIGTGGFGVVYKGVLQNGEMIAVKKLQPSMPGFQKQFENEVYHLMRLKHPNIVQFVGYCYETQHICVEHYGKYVFAEMAERLLCLEYYPKGSLDAYISDESSGLDWHTRYKIIEGICSGLHYLHEEVNKPIVHLDLKPGNILLDNDMVPKVTDFGLSRLFDQQQTIRTSTCDGTFGYMAPEYIHGGKITPKLDIFSLGVIILEVITGDRDYPDVTRTSSEDFIELAVEKWRNMLEKIPGYTSLELDCQQIKRCIQVGLICVNPKRTKRPTTTKIIKMLQGSESTDCHISNEVMLPADQVVNHKRADWFGRLKKTKKPAAALRPVVAAPARLPTSSSVIPPKNLIASASRPAVPLEEDPEYIYLRTVLERGGLIRTTPFNGYCVSSPVDPFIFRLLELEQPMDEPWRGPLRHIWHRKLLFHLVQEIQQAELLDSARTGIERSLDSHRLLGKLWRRVRGFPAVDSSFESNKAHIAPHLWENLRGQASNPAVVEEASNVTDGVAELLLEALLAECAESLHRSSGKEALLRRARATDASTVRDASRLTVDMYSSRALCCIPFILAFTANRISSIMSRLWARIQT